LNKVCPVKGEEIDADAPTVEYNGKLIVFCCPGCDSKFQKDPEKIYEEPEWGWCQSL